MSGEGLEDFLTAVGVAGVTDLQGRSPTAMPPPPPAQQPPDFATRQLPPLPGSGYAVPVKLAQALKEPEVGTEELPTVGSVEHRRGTCRPCAPRA